jgi:adenylate cyclase
MPQSRHLAAIMFTDIVGYTALMGENEQRALDLLRNNRNLHQAIIGEKNGKWLKEMGDGTLASFKTTSEAIECARDLMKSCMEKGITLRIGVHQGEIIEENGDIYGDGVNIASRLESLAPAGDIYVSEPVARNIANKIGIDADFIGEEKLKNVKHPIRVYKISTGISERQNQVTEIEKLNLKSDDKSIAVLPFDNMSGDPEQSYFSDGITEDIITDLSKVSSLFVIARNSSFTYKGKSVKIKKVCSDLGVRYVVEGSVRKAGNRVRITAQLIDGLTEGHIWADRYDGTLDDIFELQDEVTCQIIEALKIRLLYEEREAIKKTPTSNIEAYELYLKGRQYFHYGTKENFKKAQMYFSKAAELDESYALAYCGLADCSSYFNSCFEPDYPISDALSAAAKAIALNPNLAEGHASLGLALSIIDDYKGAEKEFETAVRLDPSLFEARYYWARTCFTQGKLIAAANHFEKAWELSPKDPQTPSLLLQVYRSLGRQHDLEHAAKVTIEAGQQKLKEEPDDWRTHLSVAFGLNSLQRFSEAKEYLSHAIDNNSYDPTINYNVACLYAGMGEVDKAIYHLEISLKLGNHPKGWIENDSDLDPLRDLPEFRKLMEKYMS